MKDGRTFDTTDDRRKVSVINETMARRYFGNKSALGKRWGYGSAVGENAFEIMGVVEDARYSGRDLRAGESLNMAYLPAAQDSRFLQSLEVQVSGDPAAFATAVRNALHQVEPRLPVVGSESVEARVGRALGAYRLLAGITTAVGVIALGLACLGLFGTMSYAVTRRTMELGMRIALGAGRGSVQWLVMREALTLVLFGLLVALPLAFLAARAVGQVLYGVVAYDLWAYGAAMTTLVLVTAVAAYLPARRASRLDPMKALRAD
jgi:ABC-type lipoprotein release transport system permease subunit